MSGFIGQIMGVAPMLTQLLGAAEGANAGGLPGLVAQLEQAGLGAQVRSWVGSGENLPVTGQQIAGAIPPEMLTSWSERLGVPQDQLSEMLADILPHAVDHATPGGDVPHAGAPSPDFTGLLGRLMGR